MIEAALRVDVEARRLLFVERAQASEAAAAALQLDRLSDEIDELRLPPDAVDRLLTDHLPGALPHFGTVCHLANTKKTMTTLGRGTVVARCRSTWHRS